MDFGALPPEVNSARMYAGPGSESMIAAAEAWDGLAAELRATADSYGSVIAGLTDASWVGPSSAAMAAAAAPYAAWMSATAAQAEQTATLARSAANAYETAFAATVPPPLVAANRSQLASLVATNIFGQNTSAIAAAEAQYGEMWAQDAAAMYTYAAQSAAASSVTPFTPAPPTTDPGGVLGQLVTAVASIGAGAQTQLSQTFAAVPAALHSLASIATSPNPLQGMLSTLQSLAGMQSLSSISGDIELIPKVILPVNDTLIFIILGVVAQTRLLVTAPAAIAGSAGSLAAGLASTTHVAGVAAVSAAATSAGMGHAGLVGDLSVPPSSAAATPAIRLAATVLHGTSLAGAPAVVADGSGGLFGQMALAGMAGSALGGAAPRTVGATAGRIGLPTVDKNKQTPDKLKRVLAEMSLKPESVQHWHTDQAHLDSLLAQLSKKPGIHAVHLSRKGTPTPKPQAGQSGQSTG